jgi:glycosyltransferase involved in cell wall biosynthesis
MAVHLTALVLTYNEELNLPACLESLKPLQCEIVVVDSGSTDRTVEIAEAAGTGVIYHEFHSQAQQVNWALEHLPVETEWVLRLDADERLTPELAQELGSNLSTPEQGINGYYIKRRVYFMGRWIRHGGYYPTWLLRVWKLGTARAEERLMDEHMILAHGKAAFLDHDILEDNQKGLFEWVEKHVRYSTREAQASIAGPNTREIRPSLFGPPETRRRWLRNRIYHRLPLFLRAFLYFAYRYVIRLGFLDGRRGLVFHFLQGFWYRFQVDAFILESRLREQPHGDSPAAEAKAESSPKRKNL